MRAAGIDAIGIVTGAVYGIERLSGQEDVIPPADIATLRRDEIRPSARGIPPFVFQSAAVALLAVLGRKVLRLRLD